MSKILVIAEKPSVAREIAEALFGRKPSSGNVFTGKGPDGSDVTVAAARGHLMELAKPEAYSDIHGKDFGKWVVTDLPILPKPGWDFIQVPRGDAKDLVETLKRLAAEHSGHEIVNACDAGREGELIFRKVLAVFPITKAKTKLGRMWFSSMTGDAIRESFTKRHPLAKYDGLARAGYTRDEADWLVGMNMTVLATKTLPRGGGDWKLWSVGRVQTPTLALIVERDLAIENFTTEAFYEVYADFDGLEAKAVLDAIVKSPDRAKLLGAPRISEDIEKKAFWARDMAGRYVASAQAAPNYKATDKSTEKTSAVLPLNLQEAQKIMFKKFGLSADETLGVLQKLYEVHKLVSYPRTDSRHFPEDMRAKIHQATADALAGVAARLPKLHLSGLKIAPRAISDKSRAFNSKEVSDHYALCPTGQVDALSNLNEMELKAYLSVLQATLMSLDEPCRIAVVTRRFVQQGGSGPYSPAEFRAFAEKVVAPGWTRWVKREEAVKAALPALPAAKTVPIGEASIRDLKTNPPKPFGDDTLLTAMENAGSHFTADDVQEGVDAEAMADIMKGRGIGTAATRASIIKTLEARHYIERQQKRLVATDHGRLLIQSMNKLDPTTTSAAMTAEWELVLKRMEDGEAVSREDFLDGLLKQFIKAKDIFMAATKRSLGPSGLVDGAPVDGALCPKSGKPILDRGAAFEAPGFEGVLLWKTGYGRTWTAREFVSLLMGVLSEKPATFTGMKTKAGREYQAPLTIDPQANKVVIFEPSEKVKGAKCPRTKEPVEDRGSYWFVPGWPKLRLYKTAFGKTWKLAEYLAVLESNLAGKPMLVTGLLSKANKPYEAMLVAERGHERWDLKFADRGAPRASTGLTSSDESWENAKAV